MLRSSISVRGFTTPKPSPVFSGTIRKSGFSGRPRMLSFRRETCKRRLSHNGLLHPCPTIFGTKVQKESGRIMPSTHPGDLARPSPLSGNGNLSVGGCGALLNRAAETLWYIPGRFSIARLLGPGYSLRCVLFHDVSDTESAFT